MQLLWFLPSLAYGLMLGVTSGNYFLAGSTLFTMAIAALIRYRMSRRPKIGPATRLRVLGKNIWIDDYRLPRAEIFWTREHAEFVFERLSSPQNLSSIRDSFFSRSFERDTQQLNIALGFNELEIVQRSLVEDGPHAILIGSTGSGKTELLRRMLRELLEFSPDSQLVCIDFKGGSGLGEFESATQLLCSDQDLEKTQTVMEWLCSELSRREQSDQGHARLIIAIDELAHLLTKVKIAASTLDAIAARGRSASMHLIMTNQNLVGVGRAMLSNIKLRVLIGNPDPVDAAMLGQLARTGSVTGAERGLAAAQLVAHATSAVPFSFALPGYSLETREQSLAQKSSGRGPQPLPSSREPRREYSSRERARHRQSRQLSIRGLLSHARKAVWR